MKHFSYRDTTGQFVPKQVVWQIKEEQKEAAEFFMKELSLNPVLARIVSNRNISTVEEFQEFFKSNLSDLIDPFNLKDMDIAVERIGCALNNHEPIMIYGDYDSDGITATVVLLKTLGWLSASPEPMFYIPHRLNEGYGLNKGAIESFASRGIKLIITVDTGISCLEAVAYANSLDIDVIITDHHQVPEQLPAALAIIDPNQSDCSYPESDLAGVGVAFKLAHALLKSISDNEKEAKKFLFSLLDIVALGTVADMAPMRGENRALVKHGLEVLAKTDKIGLALMLENSGSRSKPVTSETIGYFIAPRLNVAGRTEHANTSVELLLCEDLSEGARITHHLDSLNKYRRTLEEDILREAKEEIQAAFDLETEKIIVAAGNDWHLGVIGIVASKLVETYCRPVVLLSKENNVAKGSVRSVEGFDIFKALTYCKDTLIDFGGHKMAAGIQVSVDKIDQLRKQINEYAETHLPSECMVPRVCIDTYLKGAEISFATVNAIATLGPFGQLNPRPLFFANNVRCVTAPRIVGERHLKLKLEIDEQIVDAIGFSMANYHRPLMEERYETIDIAFFPFINEWMGNRKVEIDLRDIRLN